MKKHYSHSTTFGSWGFAPVPEWGGLISPSLPLLFKGGGGRKRGQTGNKREGRKGEGRGGRGKKEEEEKGAVGGITCQPFVSILQLISYFS